MRWSFLLSLLLFILLAESERLKMKSKSRSERWEPSAVPPTFSVTIA
jgi:hypothetical protein